MKRAEAEWSIDEYMSARVAREPEKGRETVEEKYTRARGPGHHRVNINETLFKSASEDLNNGRHDDHNGLEWKIPAMSESWKEFQNTSSFSSFYNFFDSLESWPW